MGRQPPQPSAGDSAREWRLLAGWSLAVAGPEGGATMDGAAAGEGGGPCLEPQVAEGNGPITWRARKSHAVAQKGDPWEAIPGPK